MKNDKVNFYVFFFTNKSYIPDNLKVHGTQFMPKKPLMKNVILEATQV